MRSGPLEYDATSKGFRVFILAAAIIIRVIAISMTIGISILILALQIVMIIICVALGILTISLKKTLAKNANTLRICVRLSFLAWISLGVPCAVFQILELVNAPFSRQGSMGGAFFSWIVLLICGTMFLGIFWKSLSFYIRALNYYQTGQNERMINNYTYGYEESRFPSQPMPDAQLINVSSNVGGQPLYFPPGGNPSNRVYVNGTTHYENPYGAS